MIRKSVECDIDTIMQIWLDTNIKAHYFIPKKYWTDNYDMVRGVLPQAEIYVYENYTTRQIDGFIGLLNEYIEGIFVRETAQSNGIGKILLDFVKNKKGNLSLNVYQKNTRAIHFYKREGFKLQSEDLDDNTGEKEFTMIWNS